MTDTSSTMPLPPPRIVGTIRDLWEAEFETERQAFGSARFRMLAHICSSVYPEIPASRLPKAPTGDHGRRELHEALQNFFRWIGAPWYRESLYIAAEKAAARLNAAFLLSEVQRIYFLPLDQLGLVDTTKRPHEDLRRISFGQCEIVLLEDEQLVQRVPVQALGRFEQRYWFESERLAGFYYLVVRVEEQAGPIWQRGHWATLDQFLGKRLEEIGQLILYDPAYPEPVEDALFTILLCFLKNPSVMPGKPFAIPWLYSYTDDPFSEPPRAPDPSPLSWKMIGDSNDEQELPDRSSSFLLTKAEIEDSLGQRWERLHAALNRSQDGRANLHPLTKHFFVKAFQEEGVDEIIALISCIEDTLMLPDERGNNQLKKRYKKLVNDDTAYNSLELAYSIRRKYLHALGDQRDAIDWEELVKCRWAVAKAVDNYLTLSAESGEDRENLLRSLKRQPEG